VAVQLALTQGEFVKIRLPEARSALQALPPAPSAPPPETNLILTRVAAGEPVIYDTGKNGPVELFDFFRLSYALAPRNEIWWAATAPVTSVEDWWEDVSGGPDAIRNLAARKHARYVMFAEVDVPNGLHYLAAWRMSGQIALVELRRA
jgi:hypothetical protein